MPETPDHRIAIGPRSGDDHVITADGELVNLDQQARDAAAAEAAALAAREDRKARKGADPETPAA